MDKHLYLRNVHYDKHHCVCIPEYCMAASAELEQLRQGKSVLSLLQRQVAARAGYSAVIRSRRGHSGLHLWAPTQHRH